MPKSSPSIGLDVQVDTTNTDRELKEVRKDVAKTMKEGLVRAGQIVLPEARRRAPKGKGRLAASLVVKATSKRAFLTTNLRGKKGRFVGILEFGGTVSRPIVPKTKKALFINGRFASRVSTPRHYKAHHFMGDAVLSKRPQIQQAMQREVLESFRAAGFDVS